MSWRQSISIFSYVTLITVQNNLHHFVCTILSFLKMEVIAFRIVSLRGQWLP